MKQEVKQLINNLKLLHLALSVGVITYLLIAFYLNQIQGAFLEETTSAFIVVLVVTFISIAIMSSGFLFFKQKMAGIESLELNEKLEKYKEALIIRAACFEGAAFLFTTVFLLFGSSVFFIEACAVFILMILYFPSNYRIAKEIKHDLRDLP